MLVVIPMLILMLIGCIGVDSSTIQATKTAPIGESISLFINDQPSGSVSKVEDRTYIDGASALEKFNIACYTIPNFNVYGLEETTTKKQIVLCNDLLITNGAGAEPMPLVQSFNGQLYIPVAALRSFGHDIFYYNDSIYVDSPQAKQELERSQRQSIGTFECTAYCDSPSENGGYTSTACGTPITPYYTIAVDPTVIPLGTKLYVEG